MKWKFYWTEMKYKYYTKQIFTSYNQLKQIYTFPESITIVSG